jgi:hypothetical protein
MKTKDVILALKEHLPENHGFIGFREIKRLKLRLKKQGKKIADIDADIATDLVDRKKVKRFEQ